ncbi:malate synthase [Salix suchowensis]|nr:malate synthase [Salix suchowensis]
MGNLHPGPYPGIGLVGAALGYGYQRRAGQLDLAYKTRPLQPVEPPKPFSTTMSYAVTFHAKVAANVKDVLFTDGALKFLTALHRNFEATRQSLLASREDAQRKRVEITGPTDRKMVINAMNSGAKTFMADFEDSSSPTFANMVNGQINLRDAIRRQIDFEISGKQYKLSEDPAVLIVRPRGWHLDELRVYIDGAPMSGSLFDFGLYFYHNAKELHYLEARLWNDVFVFSQTYIGMPLNTIRATVLIETLPAAFHMEEILFELRNHSSGLNCGRWDYIFSFIKKRRADRGAVLPDRKDVTMTVGFMDAYVRLLIQTCHKYVAAMGGMSAQIPIKDDPKANEVAMAKVRADKLREVTAGHDGTWIAHPSSTKLPAPSLTNTCKAYAKMLPQLSLTRLLGSAGMGVFPQLLMEDAATAEITRVQLWQWVKYGSRTDTGVPITVAYVDDLIKELAPGIKKLASGAQDKDIQTASEYIRSQIRATWPSEFLTSDLMPYLAVADGVEPKYQKAAL